MNDSLDPQRLPVASAAPLGRPFVEWVDPPPSGRWFTAPVRLVLQALDSLRAALRLGVVGGLLAVTSAPAQDAPQPVPAPAPAPTPADSKPRPVVLDPATVAKLREIAFDAAREGDTRTLEEYFKTGQPAEITNARGDSLLILASYHGHAEAVRVILDQPKTPINARNKMGFTALTGASYKGNIEIVKQLAVKKADLNSANERGQTALMYAAMFGRAEVVQYLVDQKVNLQARDDAGKTALDLARFQGAAETVKILEAAAQPKPPVE